MAAIANKQNLAVQRLCKHVQALQVFCHLNPPLLLWNMDPANWLWKGIKAFETKRTGKLLHTSYLEHINNDWMRGNSTSLWVYRKLLWQLTRDGNLRGSGKSRATTASQNTSFRNAGVSATPWSTEEMLDGQHQRENISALAGTAHMGLLHKRLEEDICWIVPRVPLTTRSVNELNWTELNRLWAFNTKGVFFPFFLFSFLSFFLSLSLFLFFFFFFVWEGGELEQAKGWLFGFSVVWSRFPLQSQCDMSVEILFKRNGVSLPFDGRASCEIDYLLPRAAGLAAGTCFPWKGVSRLERLRGEGGGQQLLRLILPFRRGPIFFFLFFSLSSTGEYWSTKGFILNWNSLTLKPLRKGYL